MKKFKITKEGPGYLFYPVDQNLQRKIDKHLQEFQIRGGAAYFQNFEEVQEAFPEKKQALKYLSAGWTVTVVLDPWSALHIWGWDCHTIAENGNGRR